MPVSWNLLQLGNFYQEVQSLNVLSDITIRNVKERLLPPFWGSLTEKHEPSVAG